MFLDVLDQSDDEEKPCPLLMQYEVNQEGGRALTMDPEVLLKAFSIHQEFWSFCIAVKLCQRTKSPHHYHTPHQFSRAAEKVRHLFPAQLYSCLSHRDP